MSVKRVVALALALLLALTMAACGSPAATAPQSSTGATSGTNQPAGSAQLGEQIFTTGNAADGSAVGVSAGRGGPCARCHGTDAKGILGPDIRWSVLTGAATSAKAPRFPLADEAEFHTAVTTGMAAGNQLKPMMPHYDLTPAQAAALAAYLKTL